MKGITISTFAVALTGNKGSASMLESIVDNLTKEIEDVQFYVFTHYPKVDRKRNRYPNVHIRNSSPLVLVLYILPICLSIWALRKLHIPILGKLLGKAVKDLVQSDLVLEVGGTTFTDAKPIKIIYNVACMLPPILLNKRIMMYSQTAGPFNSTFNKTLAKFVLPHVSIAVGRGRRSAANLKGLGLKNVEYCADGAFTMNYHEGIEEKMEATYRPLFDGGKKIVGISPNSIVETKCRKNNIDHSGIFGKFIDYLQDRDYKVVLIPHSLRKNIVFKRHNNDSYTVRDIVRQVRNSKDLMVVEDDHNAEELRMIIKQTDFYVASRFHSMISALVVGSPVLVVGWGYQKYVEVMEEFELENYTFDASELSVDRLVSEFEKVVAEETIIKKRIADNLPKVVESSRRNIILAESLLDLDEADTR